MAATKPVNPSQTLLDSLAKALQPVLNDENYPRWLAQIKHHFALRDFAAIFANNSLLGVYACNYVPGRMLAYHSLLNNLDMHWDSVLCLGAGNGAELYAFFSKNVKSIHISDLAHYCTLQPMIDALFDGEDPLIEKSSVDGNLLDTVQRLTLTENNTLPNITLTDKTLPTSKVQDPLTNMQNHTVNSNEDDVLPQTQLPEISTSVGNVLDSTYLSSLVPHYNLTTTNFLLNEILTQSKSSFVALIQSIVSLLSKGSYWLVVDAASSFSETRIGGSKHLKRPVLIYELLDKIGVLEQVSGEDSVWFRVDKGIGLEYPCKIQNMRYFYRLYRKM